MIQDAIPASRSLPIIDRLLRATFPEFRGRRVTVRPWTGPVWVQWNWDEGRRDLVRVVTQDGKVAVPTVPAPWNHDWPKPRPEEWGPGAILVVLHEDFGRQYVTIYASPTEVREALR
jgi:hypothetical protein